MKKDLKNAEYIGEEKPRHVDKNGEREDGIFKFHRLRNKNQEFLIAETKDGKKYYITKDVLNEQPSRVVSSTSDNIITDNVENFNPTQMDDKSPKTSPERQIQADEVSKTPQIIKKRGAVNTINKYYGDDVSNQITDRTYQPRGYEVNKAEFNNLTPEAKANLINDTSDLSDLATYGRAEYLKQEINGGNIPVSMINKYEAVPEIIKNGKIYDRQTNWKNRNEDTAVIIAPFKMNNKDYVGEVVVKKTRNRQGFLFT